MLILSPEIDLQPFWVSGEFPRWGFLTRSLPCERKHTGLHVLFSYSDRYRDVSINFFKTRQYKISWKSVQPFYSYMQTDIRTDKHTGMAKLVGAFFATFNANALRNWATACAWNCHSYKFSKKVLMLHRFRLYIFLLYNQIYFVEIGSYLIIKHFCTNMTLNLCCPSTSFSNIFKHPPIPLLLTMC
jgi:hypothetical protein